MQTSSHNGGPPVAPESVWTAMVRVYDIARQLARNAVLALAGSILLLAGWFVLSWGVVNLVASGLPPAWRFVIDAAINVAVGGVLVWLAARGQTRREKI